MNLNFQDPFLSTGAGGGDVQYSYLHPDGLGRVDGGQDDLGLRDISTQVPTRLVKEVMRTPTIVESQNAGIIRF